MTKSQPLQVEVQRLRTELHALREQITRYSVRPPIPTDHPHIVRIEGVQSGEPVVRGVNVTVRGIVELTQQGQTPLQIVKEHAPLLSLAQVYDALSYYYDHAAEIETSIREQRRALARATKLSRAISKQRRRTKGTSRSKKGNAYAGR